MVISLLTVEVAAPCELWLLMNMFCLPVPSFSPLLRHDAPSRVLSDVPCTWSKHGIIKHTRSFVPRRRFFSLEVFSERVAERASENVMMWIKIAARFLFPKKAGTFHMLLMIASH